MPVSSSCQVTALLSLQLSVVCSLLAVNCFEDTQVQAETLKELILGVTAGFPKEAE